jgi:hypothetical protein
MIAPPEVCDDEEMRQIQCQLALTQELNFLIERATAAGWRRDDVLFSIGNLVDTETVERAEFFQHLMEDSGASPSLTSSPLQ